MFLSEELSDQNQQDINKLRDYIYSCSGELSLNTDLTIKSGSIVSSDLTLMHNRSVAENVKVRNLDGTLFEGIIKIENGKLNTTDIYIEGSSLLLGADLTGKAFTRSVFGD